MKQLYSILLISLISLFSFPIVYGQTYTNADCLGAIPFCESISIPTYNLSGPGNVSNEFDAINSCLSSGETNSVWIKMNILTSGVLSFSIVVDVANVDLDWAIFNLTNASCSDIYSNPALQVSCDFSGSTFPTQYTGPNGGINPQDESPIPVLAGDTYYLLINNFSGEWGGNSQITFQFNEYNTCEIANCNTVKGKIVLDQDNNCNLNGPDVSLNNQRIALANASNVLFYETRSNATGEFKFSCTLTNEDLHLQYISESPLLVMNCASFPPVINSTIDTALISNSKMVVDAVQDCYLLNIEHTNPLVRTCSTGGRYVKIKNNGTIISPLTFVTFNYDEIVFPYYVDLPFEQANPHTIKIQIPTLLPTEELQFFISDSISCNAVQGFNTCTVANFDSQTNCDLEENNGLLRFSLISLTEQDSFLLRVNYTSAFANNIYESIKLRIGSTTIATAYTLLSPGETFDIPFHLTDHTSQLYLSIDHLNNQYPVGYFSNVNDNGTLFFSPNSTAFGQAAVCETIRNSYDPNDITGIPSGIGSMNMIGRDDFLKYRIRFQNTGNDAAYRVIIRDTLNSFLDETTVVPGLSSHPYQFERQLNKLIFKFQPIVLTDSTTDEPNSKGFVEYSIRQKTSNPITYQIPNRASIYFDYNEPIQTNTFTYLISPISGINEVNFITPEIFPNPANSTIQIHGLSSTQLNPYTIFIRDITGRIVQQNCISNENASISIEQLDSGIYMLELFQNGKLCGASKWIRE